MTQIPRESIEAFRNEIWRSAGVTLSATQVRQALEAALPIALEGVVGERDEAQTVSEQLLGEREGLRIRRPDLSRAELQALLGPEDEIPTNRSEYLRQSARAKLEAVLATLDSSEVER